MSPKDFCLQKDFRGRRKSRLLSRTLNALRVGINSCFDSVVGAFLFKTMETLIFNDEYFSIADTLLCGQVFRFKRYQKGYLVISTDKICYAYNENGNAYIQTEYPEYFYNYFDLSTDYSRIVLDAVNSDINVLKTSATLGKGIRILRQNSVEALYHFIISQINNIPRIQSSIEKLAVKAGRKITSPFGEYYSFPTPNELCLLTEEDFKSLGLGYRAGYFKTLTNSVINNVLNLSAFSTLTEADLYKALISIKGVGDKVANCVILFGYHKTKSFPVDTWIEKIYRENFNGTLTDRKKITEYFINRFGENSGYFQQYLFYYKRSLENKN